MIHRHFRRFPAWLIAVLALGMLTSASLAWLARRAAVPPAAGAPRRVILFAPNLTEAAWALGYGDRIVALDDYAIWPPALLDLPRVGGMVDPNLERILALSPDLLVVQGRNEQLREFARVNGIRLGSVTMDTDLETVLSAFAVLDSLLSGDGSPHAAKVVAHVRGELALVQDAAAGLERPRVLLVLGRQPDAVASLWTAGRGTFLTDLLSIAGGESIAADRGRDYFELSLETLLVAAPEVIVELRPGERVDADEVARTRALWHRTGLVDARVELCSFEGAQIPGPRLSATARALFAALHPAAAALAHPTAAPWDGQAQDAAAYDSPASGAPAGDRAP